MKKQLQTISGEYLMSQPLEPIKFIVNGLIPQGLHIFAGSPKIGKSWLMLWLCLQVAKGEKVWNYDTVRGTTLYLCLEDSKNRIQNRLFDITDDAPNIHFAPLAENINNGLQEQIEDFLFLHSDTNLIVIDTLQKIRNAQKDSNQYANDYREINILKSLADKHSIAIILVHHLRKMNDDDPVNMVSGTTGITGVVDSSYILKKDMRNSKKATLICTGRDIEYREIEIEFNGISHIWDLISVSDMDDVKPSDNILQVIKDYIFSVEHFVGTSTELATTLEKITEEKFHPPTLSKRLLQNADYLQSVGITYKTKRTGTRREIFLSVIHDSNDGNDGKNDIAPASNLLSQLSSPSQNERGTFVALVCDFVAAGGIDNRPEGSTAKSDKIEGG